jgi:glucosamine 6-phosphate synthetase-like amidotransferase/phosphosugar isomerase protein
VTIEHVMPMPDMAVNFAPIVYAAPIQMLAYHTRSSWVRTPISRATWRNR